MSIIDAIPRLYEDLGNAEGRRAMVGAIWGHGIEDIGQTLGQIPQQQLQMRSMALREQEQQLAVAKAQREAAADQALSQATSAAVNPDGTINMGLLTTHLAGTPAASRIPQITESLNRMQESGRQLQISSKNAGEAENDALGAVAHGASLAGEPGDQGGVFLAGVAAGVKNGSISQDRAKQEVAGVMGPDGNPDPDKLKTSFDRLTKNSKEQRTLAEGEERAQSLASEREDTVFQKQLARYSNQLASAPDQTTYTQRYQGIDPKFQAYFDAPGNWTKDSATRAAQATMRPQDRIAQQRADQQAADQKAREARLDSYERARIGIDQGKLQVERDRLAAETAGSGAVPKGYQQYVTEFNKARDEERQRAGQVPVDPDDPFGPKRPAVGPYVPPASAAKWAVMTPQERQADITKPTYETSINGQKQTVLGRISDDEVIRRQGGTPPATAGAPAPATTQPPTSTTPAAPAAQAKPTPAPAAPVKVKPYTPPPAGAVELRLPSGNIARFANRATLEKFMRDNGLDQQ